VVTYNFDAAGRLGDQDSNLAFTGNLGDGVARTYARGISYEPTGAMKEERLGTGTVLYHKLAYNSRGQLTDIRVSTSSNDDSWNRGKISNSYGTTSNNGNLLQQNIYIPTNDQGTTSVSWYQTYTYDSLNRLKVVGEWNSAGMGMWGQHFVYDRFGNRTIDQWNSSSIVNRMNYAVDPATNRLMQPGGQTGMTYDAAGNQIGDTYTGAGWSGVETSPTVLNYDAENRITSVQNNYGQSSQYGYDANSQRIKRTIIKELINLSTTFTWRRLVRWLHRRSCSNKGID
jgi:YD repeat-containing protein